VIVTGKFHSHPPQRKPCTFVQSWVGGWIYLLPRSARSLSAEYADQFLSGVGGDGSAASMVLSLNILAIRIAGIPVH
jgi:hypothetical protein